MTIDKAHFLSSVDAILQDADALQVFREWIRLYSPESVDCLALHFAIKGYQTYLSRKELNTSSVACTLHRKFISQRTGTCSFLPSSVRSETSRRVHSLNSQQPPYPELFEPVQSALRHHLNVIHSKFVTSPSFLTFLAQNNSEGSSLTSSMDEVHLPPHPYLTATPTISRDYNRRNKIFKTRTSSSDPTTSRCINDGRRDIEVDRERHLYKHTDGSIRHDIPEARVAFASVLTERLEIINKELERSDENTFARDLPRDLAACSLLPSLHDNRIIDDTTSDEEVVEKYVGTIDGTCRRSELDSPGLFNFQPIRKNPYENGFAPPPQEVQHFFTLSPYSIFPKSSKSMEGQISDSSGFCSSESAYLSDKNFGKKKNNMIMHGHHHLVSNSFNKKQPTTIPISNASDPMKKSTSTLTLIMRENEQPPMVAKIPSDVITLSKFRRMFGVSRNENKRFLFKSASEYDGAPFQWNLITDDNAVLPLFDGKIIADCRHFNESD